MQVLVPVDLSDESAALVRYAARLASLVGGELEILHVYTRDSAMAALRDEGLFLDLYVSRLRSELNYLKAQAGVAGQRARVEVRQGDPVETIVERAAELRADLIVVGTHRRTGLTRLLVGSVAAGVLRRAPCPVVLVPASVLAGVTRDVVPASA
ncbi:MAG: universal stress protein [Armatimonadota bacterium]|nr:universal stress protein [Armatimonadota bacterium]MDR7486478.1 universal stress protein [Armatimonadota bacterium]MDR7532244.1 universal stress protein [Armatimonadota bacterium]MDR7537181.1 universal stress protein [Armatimonadota bacterium]